jgi:hypothetical protein
LIIGGYDIILKVGHEKTKNIHGSAAAGGMETKVVPSCFLSGR